MRGDVVVVSSPMAGAEFTSGSPGGARSDLFH